MSSSFRRNVAAVGVCTFLVSGALSRPIEYSLRAQPSTTPSTSPSASSTATPNSSPATSATIDPKAQQALTQMRAAYANLKSFSADIKLSGSAGVPQLSSSIQWQKPNRFSVSIIKGIATLHTVSDGKTLFRALSTQPKQYQKVALPTGVNTLPQALEISGAPELMLSSLNSLVSSLQAPTLKSLTLDNAASTTQTVTALMKDNRASGQFALTIANSDHLLRQINIHFGQVGATGQQTDGTETYSNVQVNPVLPASTFAFVPPAGAKLFVPPSADVTYDPRLEPGAAPFAFSATATNGQKVSPAKYKGRVVLLDFWATWCGPCVGEFPNVKATYQKYHAQGFDIVGISLDEDRSALSAFIKDRGVLWPQVFDGKGWHSAIPNLYGVQAIPFTVLIGRDGKIAAVDVRGETLEPAVRAALAKK